MTRQGTIEYFVKVLLILLAAAIPFKSMATLLSSTPEGEQDSNILSPEIKDLNDDIWKLFDLPLNQVKDAKSLIQSKEQALREIKHLKTALRERGDLAAIGSFAPRIMEFTPKNVDILFLYSIYLSAMGDPTTAENYIQGKAATVESKQLELLARASIAKALGNLDMAEKSIKRLIEIDPRHAYAYNLLGQIEASKGKYKQAEKNFKTAITLSPKFATAYSNLGVVQYRQGDMGAAWQSFSESLYYEPNYCAPLIGRAAVAQYSNNFNAAILDLERCIQSDQNNVNARQQLFPLYMTVARYEDAVTTAKALSESAPSFSGIALAEAYLRLNEVSKARQALDGIVEKNAQAQYLLSFCAILSGNVQEAIAITDRLSKEHQEWPTPWIAGAVYKLYAGSEDEKAVIRLLDDKIVGKLASFVLGSIYAAQGNQKKAEMYWRQADSFLPGYTLSGISAKQVVQSIKSQEQKHLALGLLLYLKNLHEPALEEFNKAITKNRESFLSYYFAALASNRIGDMDNTKTYLLKSLEYAPKFYSANALLAQMYLRSGDKSNAIKYYKRAVSSKADAGVLIRLGLLQEGNNDLKGAEKSYRTFIKEYPDNFIGYNQLAWLFAKNETNLDEALQLAQRADKLRPGNVSINDTLGWIYFHKKDYTQANRYLEHANSIAKGRNPDVLYHLAVLCEYRGKSEEAKSHLNNAFAISSDFESADAARKLLAKLK